MWMAPVIPLLFYFLGGALSWKSTQLIGNMAKRSTYECGFSPFSSPRGSFSVYFFLVGILFVLFDVEIVVLLVLPLVRSSSVSCLISLYLFIVILVAGLYHEWREGSLDWPAGLEG